MLVFDYIQNVKADTFHGPGALVKGNPLKCKTETQPVEWFIMLRIK